MQYKCNYTLFQFNLNQMRYLSEDSRIVGCCPSQFHRRANLSPPTHTAPRATGEKKKNKSLTNLMKEYKNSKNCCSLHSYICLPWFSPSSKFGFSFFLSTGTLEGPHMKFCLSCDLRLFLWTSSPPIPRKLKRQGEHSEFLIPWCQFFSFQKQEFLFADFLKCQSLEWMVFLSHK